MLLAYWRNGGEVMLTTILRCLRISKGDTNQYVSDLAKLAKDLNRLKMTKKVGLKILYGPSFCLYAPCYVHDSLFSLALRIRGTEIIPVYCDAVQTTECNFYGGVWGGGDKFAKNCSGCCEISERLWSNAGLIPLRFSKYIGEDDLQIIDKEIESLHYDEWLSYEADGLPFGNWAKDILVNNWVVGNYRRIKDHERLGRTHLKNLMIIRRVYQRMLDETRPDRVVGNDSYYGMWAILQKLCERKGIPFYSHWTGAKQDSWCYAYNDAAMNLDFSKAWVNYSRLPLDARRRRKAQEWLDGRLVGKNLILDTASLSAYKSDKFDESSIDSAKPIALLTSNLIWDMAALNKNIVFTGMMEWIAETIEWFGEHPQYQLIIKPHPAELHPSLPETEDRVEVALKQRGVILPENVFLFSPKVNLTVYQLFPMVNVGIVFTTTAGIEMAANGIPVITVAKSPYRGYGFTIDPVEKDEYFTALKKTLQQTEPINKDKLVELAMKFILFYHHHYYTRIDFMNYKFGETPIIKVKNIEDLFPGKNTYLDYIVDSIIQGLPIISDNRWPEEC